MVGNLVEPCHQYLSFFGRGAISRNMFRMLLIYPEDAVAIYADKMGVKTLHSISFRNSSQLFPWEAW
uniref:Uncharacterized protein n=1 Tax=Physcomitrium patens TaxID=3218 RepID=A0A2K1II20_PHYPA|nr:hypothetical protein PHYPA_027619 [Physcomitrium patens]